MSFTSSPPASTSTSPPSSLPTSSTPSGPVTYSTRPKPPSSAHGRDDSDGMNPPTPLRPVTGTNGFVYPAIWSFPPFFTLQPNPSTLAHQTSLWTTLILSWARHQRIWTVNCDSPEPGEVFLNKAIGRRLLPPAMKQVLGQMVKDGQAVAEPPKQNSTFLLYWRKPEDWGGLIYDWVRAVVFDPFPHALYPMPSHPHSNASQYLRGVQRLTLV